MRFSLVGFIVGAFCALILFIVATSLVAFRLSDLVFGLAALALWAYLTVNPPAFTR